MKSFEEHFHLVLFIMLYKVVLTFKSVDEARCVAIVVAIEQDLLSSRNYTNFFP